MGPRLLLSQDFQGILVGPAQVIEWWNNSVTVGLIHSHTLPRLPLDLVVPGVPAVRLVEEKGQGEGSQDLSHLLPNLEL